MSVTKSGAALTTLKAVLTLMVLSAFLPEVTTGNTQIVTFFTPKVFVFLVVLGYGLPVLLIRELAVRARLGTAGILVLGFAYGSYNEGLWAKTVIDIHHVPMSAFNDYGVLGGVDVPWALTISLYHALGSVLFPILFTHALYPAERERPWIDARVAVVLAVALLALGSVAFLGPNKLAGSPAQLVFFLGVLVAGALIAPRLPRPDDARRIAPPAGVLPVLLGVGIVIPFIALSLLASAKALFALFVLAWAAIVLGYAWLMTSRGWQAPPNLLLFGLGMYMQSVLLAMLLNGAVLVHNGSTPIGLASLISGVTLEMIFIWAALRLQRGGGRASAAPAQA
ncbi:MAG TPA: hypothetical protein VIX35_06290 [Vicinamibacterales bacterium]